SSFKPWKRTMAGSSASGTAGERGSLKTNRSRPPQGGTGGAGGAGLLEHRGGGVAGFLEPLAQQATQLFGVGRRRGAFFAPDGRAAEGYDASANVRGDDVQLLMVPVQCKKT